MLKSSARSKNKLFVAIIAIDGWLLVNPAFTLVSDRRRASGDAGGLLRERGRTVRFHG